MLRKYESVIILDPDLSEQETEAEANSIADLIKENGGEVITKDIWGRRPLCYRINRKDYGIFVLYVFESPTGSNSVLDRQLKLKERVLRHLIVNKDKYAPDMSQAAREYATSPQIFSDPAAFGDAFGEPESLEEALL